jgi:hypothetical protein
MKSKKSTYRKKVSSGIHEKIKGAFFLWYKIRKRGGREENQAYGSPELLEVGSP